MISGQFGFSKRFECKYLVAPVAAAEIRLALAYHMELDKFCASARDNKYLNTSLYFDTPDYYCYRSTFAGEKNRFKMRARYYTGNLGEPLFFEEKRRTSDVISKLRVRMTIRDFEELLEGRPLRPTDLLPINGGGAEAALLAERALSLRMKPACFVRYYRQAWLLPTDEYLRVTFDTDLQGHSLDTRAPAVDSSGWTPAGDGRTVLEIKFERLIPNWLENLVRQFGLRRCSVPKYLLCHEELNSASGRQSTLARQLGIGESWGR